RASAPAGQGQGTAKANRGLGSPPNTAATVSNSDSSRQPRRDTAPPDLQLLENLTGVRRARALGLARYLIGLRTNKTPLSFVVSEILTLLSGPGCPTRGEILRAIDDLEAAGAISLRGGDDAEVWIKLHEQIAELAERAT